MHRERDAEDGERPGVAREVVAAGQVDEAVGVVEPEGLRVGVRRGEQGGGVRQVLGDKTLPIRALIVGAVDEVDA